MTQKQWPLELLTKAASRLITRYQRRFPKAPFITTYDVKSRWRVRGTVYAAARRLA